MRIFCICFYIAFLLAKEIWSLKILDFIAPSTIKNGSIPLLVMDCPYSLKKGEEKGLVVNWFYGSIPYPIYQWILGNKPQDLIFFKGRLDTTYEASKNYSSKYRALAIINPLTEYSGEYTCRVSSFDTEDSKSKEILIYSPPSSIRITYSKPRENILLITCHAEGLFPEPDIFLYRGIKSEERNRVDELSKTKKKHPIKLSYNATIHYKLYNNEIEEEELFICVVTLPGTDFMVQEELLFYKDPFLNSSLRYHLHPYLVFSIGLNLILLLINKLMNSYQHIEDWIETLFM